MNDLEQVVEEIDNYKARLLEFVETEEINKINDYVLDFLNEENKYLKFSGERLRILGNVRCLQIYRKVYEDVTDNFYRKPNSFKIVHFNNDYKKILYEAHKASHNPKK